MKVSFERGRSDRELQMLIEKLDETMKTMIGRFVASVDQRITAINRLDVRIILRQRREVWIIFPKVRTGCANVRHEPFGIISVKIPNGCREHYNVARR